MLTCIGWCGLQPPGPGGGREDKAVDAAVGAILAKVEDVKASLSSFIGKMEHETPTWCVCVCVRVVLCACVCCVLQQQAPDTTTLLILLQA